MQLREEKRDPSQLRSASGWDHVVVPRVALASSIPPPLGKPLVPSGAVGKHRWPSSPCQPQRCSAPGLNFGQFLRELNGPSLYPGNQKLIMKSCFDIPAGDPRPTTHLIIIHGLIARYTPAHLPGWQSARSPDGTLDSQGQRCQKKRWI